MSIIDFFSSIKDEHYVFGLDDFEQLNEKPKVTKSKSRLTIVTGLWNIKRDELTEGWSRSYEHYLEKFSQLLEVDCNMIIFGDSELESFVFTKRSQ